MALVRKPNDKIGDFGEKIGGARKDLWKERGLDLSDFESLDEREYATFITKENIWPTPDYKLLVEDGMSPACAYYLKFVRDKLPAKPVSLSKEHSRIYIELLTVYKEVISELKSTLDLNKDNILRKLELSAQTKGFKYLRVRPYITVLRAITLYDYEFERLVTEANLQDFPNDFKGALKGMTITSYGQNENKTYKIVQNKRYPTSKTFSSYDDALKYAKEVLIPEILDIKTEKRQTKSKTVVRPQLSGIVRTGKDERNSRDVTGDDLLNEFKFRGGEFGNWNTQDDRQACLNYAYDAFADLASVVRAPKEFISLGGYKDKKLAIAFGARGTGSALAHYEPTNIVINLTKMKGAGSLAHEWAHALDDFLGIKCADTSMLSSLNTYSRVKITYPEVKEKFEELIELLKTRPATPEEMLQDRKSKLDIYNKQLANWTDSLPNFYGGTVDQATTIKQARDKFLENPTDTSFKDLISTYKEIVGRLPSKDTRDTVGSLLRFISSTQESIDKYNKDGVFDNIHSKDTKFYAGAKNLDKSRAKPYYSTRVELFARAFESYVEDVIKKRGNKSDYLVHSTLNEYYEDLMPYPQGEERELINQKMKEFLELVVNTFAELQPEDLKSVEEVKSLEDTEKEDKGKFKLTVFKELCKEKGLNVDFGKSSIQNVVYTINFTNGHVKFVKVPVYNDITEDNHNAFIHCGTDGSIKVVYAWDKELDYNDFVNTLISLEEVSKQTKETEVERFQLTNFKELCKTAGLNIDFGVSPEENGNYIINFKKGNIKYIEVKKLQSTMDKGQFIRIYSGVPGFEKTDYQWDGKLDYDKLVKRLVSIESRLVEEVTKASAADKAKDVLAFNKLDTAKGLSPAQQEFQDMLIAAQDIRDAAKSRGLRVKLNESTATITLYHGTSKENVNKIKRTGFNPNTYFSHAKTKTGYSDEGPIYYAKTKHKNGDVVVINADARAIEFVSGTGEFYAPKGLILKGGVWKEKPDSQVANPPQVVVPVGSEVKVKEAQSKSIIKSLEATGLKDTKGLREIFIDFAQRVPVSIPYAVTFSQMLPIVQYNLTVKYTENLPVLVRSLPDDKVVGNSKSLAFDAQGNLYIQMSAEDRKKVEGLIEGVVEGILKKNNYTGLKKSMLREGITYLICRTFNLDVRTYCVSKDFEGLLKRGDVSVNNYITQCTDLYKKIIKYFI